MRLDLAAHRPAAEARGERLCAGVGRGGQAVAAARLDLGAQRRALAERDRRHARRRGTAAQRERLDLRRRGEAGGGEIGRGELDANLAAQAGLANCRRNRRRHVADREHRIERVETLRFCAGQRFRVRGVDVQIER